MLFSGVLFRKLLRRICFCGPLAFVLLAGFLAASYPRPAAKGSGITKANFDLIVEGMTQEEVEKILGCPPGVYTNGDAISSTSSGMAIQFNRHELWFGYGGAIFVEFSSEGEKVVDKGYADTLLFPKPTWLDRIKGLFQDAFSAGS
jgi:hypothetical protein